MKTVEWTAKNGTLKVVATISANYKVEHYTEELFNDGWKSEIKRVRQVSEINMITKIEGMNEIKGTPYVIHAKHPLAKVGAYAAITDTFGIKKEVYEQIEQAIKEERAEAEKNASEEWKDMEAERIAREKDNLEYAEHRAMMKKVMGY